MGDGPWPVAFLAAGAGARPGRGGGELGDQPVAQERDGGIPGGEVAAAEQRRDAAPGAPAGPRRLLDRNAQLARGGDGGEHAAEPVVRREAGRRGPPRVALLEHEAVVGRVREAVLDVAVEGPGERLDRIARRAAARQSLVEVREAVVDHARDQRRLVAEVMVDGGRRHPGAHAELADREVALGEQVLGGRQDGAPRGLRVGVAGAGEGGGAGGHGPLYSAAIFGESRGPAGLAHATTPLSFQRAISSQVQPSSSSTSSVCAPASCAGRRTTGGSPANWTGFAHTRTVPWGAGDSSR